MLSSASEAGAQDLLDFWFGAGTAERDRPRPVWWTRDAAFDAEIRQRFGSLHERASRQQLGHWLQKPEPALALVILLDQISRNLNRGTAQAFANDAMALAAARSAIGEGFDRRFAPIRAQFFYMPFMHSEDATDQERCVALFEALTELPDRDNSVAFARRHREIIARFGRFPHRNLVLGRASSPEELAFLQEPNSSF